jgi:hypothetical protein
LSIFSIATFLPTRQPSQNPSIIGATNTLTPSFRPSTLQPITLQPITLQPSTLQPTTLQPTLKPTFATTNSPTFAGVSSSSINSASNSQSGLSNTAIGAGIGCVILVILIIGACLFFNKKHSKTPYQIWSEHYTEKSKTQSHGENVVDHPPVNLKEDIHHFYSRSPRPSMHQNTVFTPHVSGRTSFRNSQIVSPIGPQKNLQRLSIATTRAAQSNYNL